MRHILIAGLPGIGKTTLVKKVLNGLRTSKIEFGGFLTEDIRPVDDIRFERSGVGARLVTTNNRALLAHKLYHQVGPDFKRLGNYTVYVKQFEELTIKPLLSFEHGILVIDEIGPLELCSSKFEDALPILFAKKSIKIMATVPIEGAGLVKILKNNKDCQVVTVTMENRDQLSSEISHLLLTDD